MESRTQTAQCDSPIQSGDQETLEPVATSPQSPTRSMKPAERTSSMDSIDKSHGYATSRSSSILYDTPSRRFSSIEPLFRPDGPPVDLSAVRASDPRQGSFGIRFATDVFAGDGDGGGGGSAQADTRRKSSAATSSSAPDGGRRKSSLADAFGAFNIRRRSQAFSRFNKAPSAKTSRNVRKPYRSTRLGNEIEKPWMQYRDPAHRWAKIIFWGLAGLGLAAGMVLIYLGVRGVPSVGKLCLVMDDDFSSGLNSDFWSHEVRLDGYGNHEFEWTTADSQNAYVEDGTLYIVPTLTSDTIGADAVVSGYMLNLTADGTCTGDNAKMCTAVSNSSTGTIINPVRSARLTTKNKVDIKYGKVEVTARMPTGDWIWPAIWMLPQNSTYGDWPRSGEIDIAESRGNNRSYSTLGSDHVSSTLHWGPVESIDSYWKTFGIANNKLEGYQTKFHKYVLEWTDEYIWMYIDNRVHSTFKLDFKESFWSRGGYPAYYQNGTNPTPLTNPWFATTDNSAPFDESFYLILNVAVGGTNGYFPDNVGGKPWLDSSPTAMKDFWTSRNGWYPTWPADPKDRGMAISSVKMWQQC